MSEFDELYQALIIDHQKRPRNFRRLADCTCHAEGQNPLCGDNMTLDVKVADGTISDIGFEGSGCAISTASASIMTEVVKGKTTAQAEELFTMFHAMVTEGKQPTHDIGKLQVFSAVGEYPARVKCATLAWHTLHAALLGEGVATTE